MKISLVVTCFLLSFLCESVHGGGRKKIVKYFANHTTPRTPSISSRSLSSTDSPVNIKTTEKITYPKKVDSFKKKPTKTPSGSIILNRKKKIQNLSEKFKDLPNEDLEFIKELDEQFKLHGDKLKFKIENDNTTSKNSKRTVDGELGYGYSHNGYQYDPPKFAFYPYSQKDIEPSAPGYYPKTEVSIEPSYSYELQPEKYTVTNQQPQIDLPNSYASQNEQIGSEEQYQEPVIVLKIPGPAKYAAHLRALLQQYLEIRATQYLRLLEEAELRKQTGEQQIHMHHMVQQNVEQNQNQQQAQYNHMAEQNADVGMYQYSPEVSYAHQIATTPKSISYPDIDTVYQNYKTRQSEYHHQHNHQYKHDQQPGVDKYYYAQQSPHNQNSEADEQQNNQYTETQSLNPEDPSYQQQYYLITMTPNNQYDEHEQDTGQQQYYAMNDKNHISPDSNLPITENNPRSTHTKVIFNHQSHQAHTDYSNMYQLPSIRHYEKYTPSVSPQYHQQYNNQEEAESASDYQQVSEIGQQESIAITQRPYNYHAHSRKAQVEYNKRDAFAYSQDSSNEEELRLQQIREYVRDKLGAQMSSTVEIKSTTIVNNKK